MIVVWFQDLRLREGKRRTGIVNPVQEAPGLPGKLRLVRGLFSATVIPGAAGSGSASRLSSAEGSMSRRLVIGFPRASNWTMYAPSALSAGGVYGMAAVTLMSAPSKARVNLILARTIV